MTLRHLSGEKDLTFHLPEFSYKVGCHRQIGLCCPACPNVSGHSNELHCTEGSKQLFLYYNKLFVADAGYMCARRYLVARFETVYQLLKTVAIYNTQRTHILSYKLNNLLCDDSSTLGGSWGTLPNQGRQRSLLFSAQAIGTSLVLFWVLCLQMTQQVGCPATISEVLFT